MRVAAAISTWLVVGFLAVFTMGGARAGILEVEPDLFPDKTVLNTAYPGVTLRNETTRGDPDETDVLVTSGFLFGAPPNPYAGTNIAPTGNFVFGRESAPPGPPDAPPGVNDNLIVWSDWLDDRVDDNAATLRADFVVPVDSVSIEARATDDDTFELQAYNASGVLLAYFNTGMIDNIKVTMFITRVSPDISYLLAFGVSPEGAGLLDNLQVNFSKRPVFINIKPDDDQNQLNICTKNTLPVAILSYDNRFSLGAFDATDVDPFSVDLEGAGVKTVGKNPERAKFKIEDTNGDGLQDMVVEIDTKGLVDVDPDTEDMTLMGEMNDETPFVGKDVVDITQFMCVRTLE